MLSILTIALLQITPVAKVNLASPPAALHDSLEAAELRFFYEWRELFKKVRDPGVPKAADNVQARALRQLRMSLAHCHPDGDMRDSYMPVPGSKVVSVAPSWFGLCPSWSVDDSLPSDERNGIDVSFPASLQMPIRQARSSLIALFEAALKLNPANDWIVGQVVRLQVDQRQLDSAMTTATNCAATAGWCGMLRGFVETARGNYRSADSIFMHAIRVMDPRERCAWNDVRPLLDSITGTHYATATCAQRDSLSTVLWWLSDPLYLTPANERRAEDFARQVLIVLHSAIDRDERYDWRPNAGGLAMSEAIRRYGWASYTWYGGTMLDQGHSGYLTLHNSPRHEPYTTFEYTPGRIHVVPSPRAITNPLQATSADWDVVPHTQAPAGNYEADNAMSRALSQLSDKLNAWWPHEFYEPDAPITQLTDGQYAFFRRDRNVVFASATDLPADSVRRPDSSVVNATLFVSPRPDSLARVASASARVGRPLALRATIAAEPAIVGIEYPGDSGAKLPAGRTRFAIAPPPPLSEMKAGEIAVSDLAVLRAPPKGRELSLDPEHALPDMLGSLRIQKGSQVGLYWETYGLAASDSVEIAVWIERLTPQGILRRFGIRLNIATDLNTPVAISWIEGGAGGRSYVIPGAIPIVARSVVLDASKLPTGNYWLDVAMRKPGGEPVRSRRSLIVG